MAKAATQRDAQAPATRLPVNLAASRGGVRLPTGDPQPGYILTAHPARWQVLAGRVVPLPGQIILRSGVGGVGKDAAGEYDPRMAVVNAERRGHIVIPPNVDAPEHASYCRKIQVQTVTGRVCESWISRFASWSPYAPAPTVDTEAYAAWLESLVDRGVVPRAEPWALEALRDRLTADLDRATKKRPDGALAKRLAADLATVTAALESA